MRAAVLTFVLLLAPIAAQAQSCPAPLASARRLVLVVAPTLSSSIARVQRFERASPDKPWRAIGGPVSALIGYRGVAWAHAFRNLARKGEPIKIDGDKRAPAGFFRIGRSFGFSPSRLPHYLRIAAGMVCVADPRSPAYNTIRSRAKVGWRVRGENMWRVSGLSPRPAGRLSDRPQGSRRLLHLHPCAAARTHRHLRLRRVAGAAGRDAAGFRAKRRGARRPAEARLAFKGCLPGPLPGAGQWEGPSIDRPLGVARIEREGRDLDVEMLALRRHHAVAAGHEAGRRRQRHAAGIFEQLARARAPALRRPRPVLSLPAGARARR